MKLFFWTWEEWRERESVAEFRVKRKDHNHKGIRFEAVWADFRGRTNSTLEVPHKQNSLLSCAVAVLGKIGWVPDSQQAC